MTIQEHPIAKLARELCKQAAKSGDIADIQVNIIVKDQGSILIRKTAGSVDLAMLVRANGEKPNHERVKLEVE